MHSSNKSIIKNFTHITHIVNGNCLCQFKCLQYKINLNVCNTKHVNIIITFEMFYDISHLTDMHLINNKFLKPKNLITNEKLVGEDKTIFFLLFF